MRRWVVSVALLGALALVGRTACCQPAAPRTWITAEDESFDRDAARYAELVQFTRYLEAEDARERIDAGVDHYLKAMALQKELEARQQAEFDAKVERAEKLQAFLHDRVAAEEEREARAFEGRLTLFLRISRFMQRLFDEERLHVPHGLAPEPEEWRPGPGGPAARRE